MFDPTILKVGDVFYTVHETNNAFQNRKEHRVIDGEDWFKYTSPLRSYDLTTSTVIGILTKTLEGEWKDKYDLETELYIQSEVNKKLSTHTDNISEFEYKEYFTNKEEAIEHIKVLEAKAMEMDKT
jgi:hypothetical protein